MAGFRVVDLGSQGSAVASYVAGWSRAQVLAWLALHGAVEPHGGDAFIFRSAYGPVTGFILTPTGEWFLIRDHTTVPVTLPNAAHAPGNRLG